MTTTLERNPALSDQQNLIVAHIPIGSRWTVNGQPRELAPFLNANDVVGEELERISKLQVGESITLWGVYEIRRMLDRSAYLALRRDNEYQEFYGSQYLNGDENTLVPGPGIEAEY